MTFQKREEVLKVMSELSEGDEVRVLYAFPLTIELATGFYRPHEHNNEVFYIHQSQHTWMGAVEGVRDGDYRKIQTDWVLSLTRIRTCAEVERELSDAVEECHRRNSGESK